MVPLRHVSGSIVASVVVVLASCHAAPTSPGHPERVEEICSASCSRRSACSEKVDEPSCEADCRIHGGDTRKYWRADYVEGAASCLRALPCSEARSAKERRTLCFANSYPAASPTALRFANLAVSQDVTCGAFYSTPPTVAQRARQFAVYDDDVLEQMIACQRDNGCGGRHDTRWECVFNIIGHENY